MDAWEAAGTFGFLRASSSALSKTFVAILRAAAGDLERKVQIRGHVLLRLAPKLRQDDMQPEVGWSCLWLVSYVGTREEW